MISLSKIPYIHRIYMVLANPTNISCLPAKISLAKISCLPAKMSYVTSQSQGVVGPVIAWCASWLHHRAHTHIQMPTWPHYRAHTHIQTSTSRVGQNCIYIRIYIRSIFGDFQAKNTVCTPYIYGSGQPYLHCYITVHIPTSKRLHGHITVHIPTTKSPHGHITVHIPTSKRLQHSHPPSRSIPLRSAAVGLMFA